MSKRTNMQARRRQIRRALNRAGDSIQSMGTSKINRIGYGCGLSQRTIRVEIKADRTAKEIDEVIY